MTVPRASSHDISLESRRRRRILSGMALREALDAAYMRDSKLAASRRREFVLQAEKQAALEKEQREALVGAAAKKPKAA